MEVHVLGSHCRAARQQMQLKAAVQVGGRGVESEGLLIRWQVLPIDSC